MIKYKPREIYYEKIKGLLTGKGAPDPRIKSTWSADGQMHTRLTGPYMIYSWSEKPFPRSLGVKSDRDWIVPS